VIVTSKSRYAVMALVELDHRTRGDARPVRLADLARERGISEPFLEQLFASLHRAGLLSSRRGAGGGFAFARPPDRVTVLEVVGALDGAPGIEACTPGACDLEERAGSGALWHAAGAAYEGVLARTTIGDLAERERQLRSGEPMYQI
jgi:Rrf2 family protein